MAITNVQITGVYVNDLDKAIDFYTNKLGFELRQNQTFGDADGTRWIEVAPKGGTTTISLIKGHGDWSPEKVGKFTTIVLTSDDIVNDFEALSSRGVKFTESPNMQFYGMMQAQFEDQDGNGYVLVAVPKQA